MASAPGVDAFAEAAARALAANDHTSISDDDIARAMSAAVKLYAARCEALGTFPAPVDASVTATEALTAICEIIRAVDVNMFELSMWHGRAAVRAQETS
jgi:hypothetical protein